MPIRRSGDTAQTLERGLEILQTLSTRSTGMTVAELSAKLAIHRPILYRLLHTLEARDFVSRGADSTYLIGHAVLSLARHAYAELQEIAMPELSSLAEDLQATALLTIAKDDTESVVLLSVEPRTAPLCLAYRVGFSRPLNRGANGLAILAGGPKVPRERKEVTAARVAGYAVTAGEVTPGVAGLAAPITVAKDVVEGSISVVTFAEMFDEAKMAPRVVLAAKRVAAGLRPRSPRTRSV